MRCKPGFNYFFYRNHVITKTIISAVIILKCGAIPRIFFLNRNKKEIASYYGFRLPASCEEIQCIVQIKIHISKAEKNTNQIILEIPNAGRSRKCMHVLVSFTKRQAQGCIQ